MDGEMKDNLDNAYTYGECAHGLSDSCIVGGRLHENNLL